MPPRRYAAAVVRSVDAVWQVLRFHFMARNELLSSHKFQWSTYLSRSMALEIENLIQINWQTCVVRQIPATRLEQGLSYAILML